MQASYQEREMRALRHDHTDWLVHFVRNRIPEQDFPGETEEQSMFYAGGETDVDADAFTILLDIIRLGGIKPGYSFRNDRTTIYGGQPAVCATEMPLYSFAQYVKSRGHSAKVSAYGVAFLKSEFYAAGGRPAIYGLSTDTLTFSTDEPDCRVLTEDLLPLREQYRYVAYNPSKVGKWVDWSHEREWRWIVQDEDKDEIWVKDYNGLYGSTPALPLFKGSLNGRPFTKVCIIVWNEDEATIVRRSLTSFYLAKENNYGTPFDLSLIEKSSIVVLEDVIKAVESGSLEAQTIEGLDAAKLLSPIALPEPPLNVATIVADAMIKAKNAAKEAIVEFSDKHGFGDGYCGFAHATTLDVTNPIVQYLLKTGAASGPYDGRVWISFPEDFPHSQSMDYAEAACEAAAEALSEALGIEVYVETRPD